MAGAPGAAGANAAGGCRRPNIDLVATEVTVTRVSLDAANASQAQLMLANGSGDLVMMGLVGGGMVSRLILPGTYDVYLSGLVTSASVAFPTTAYVKLRSGLVVGASPVSLELDAPITRVSTTLTLNGAAAPELEAAPVELELRSTNGDWFRIPAGGTENPALVVPGSYDLYYTARSHGPPGFPANLRAKLRSDVAIGTSPVSLDIDLTTTAVMVNLLDIAGALPDTAQALVTLTLRNDAGDEAALSPSGGRFSVSVLPGVYDLYFSFADGSRNPFRKLMSGITVGSSPVSLDADLSRTTVSGKVRLDGSLLTGFSDREILLLRDAEGQLFDVPLDGAGGYSRRVSPGRYDLVYRQATTGDGALPTNVDATLESGLVVAGEALSHDVDITTSVVSGKIKVNGKSLIATTTTDAEGYVGFSSTTGGKAQLGAVHAGAFSARVLPGRYDLWYSGGASPIDVPVNLDVVFLRDVAVGSSSLVLEVDVPAVRVSGSVTVNGAQLSTTGESELGAIFLDRVFGAVLAGTAAESPVCLALAKSTYSALLVPGSYQLRYSSLTGRYLVPANQDADLGCLDVQ